MEGPLRYVMLEQPGQRVEQLFDAEGDDRELEDRAAARPADVERLRAIADRYLDTPPRFGPAPRLQLDELELNQLRALGYEIP